MELTPKEIVVELNKYIVGQFSAKKAVAVALRNRWRSKQLASALQEEIIPKNILMIGPTGVGKTEIARRLAKLVNAPFIKVEATKFTEIGYVGRDVESMVRDLVETAIRMVKAEKMMQVNDKAFILANERILEYLRPTAKKDSSRNPFEILFAGGPTTTKEEPMNEPSLLDDRHLVLEQLQSGAIDDQLIDITIEESSQPMIGMLPGSGMEEIGSQIQDLLGSWMPKKQKKRKVSIAAARKIFIHEEAQKLIDMDEVIVEAIKQAENYGIIFLDEIDKIAGRGKTSGPDVSREGVQRDILPIIEGCTIITKYGPVKTDHVLFIAAGAFHVSKPSDLIPELQGRFPIRVELNNLTKEDFCQILTEPANALIKQYVSLLQTEGIDIIFADDAIDELAEIACNVNSLSENIGARRLHTILEKVLEDLAYEAPDVKEKQVLINRLYVKNKLEHIIVNQDLSQYIL